MKNQATKSKFAVDRVIVSVGSGACQLELKSRDLCLCLDKNKKSLYAGAIASQYLYRRQSRIVFFWHDIHDGLGDLLSAVSSETGLPTLVLFQHPSPSRDRLWRSSLANAFRDCVAVMLAGHIERIFFVYDVSETKNAWSTDGLKSCILSGCSVQQMSSLLISSERVISECEDITVEHPLFGKVDRAGWSKLKSGKEMCFEVTSADHA